MITEWSLRDEIFAITHQWQLPVIAFFLGCLIGWGLTFLFPTSYRAEMELYVAYNADAIYRNPDDYKNWQMRQLSDLATADIILEETLSQLKANDPYWQKVTTEEFRHMLRVLWRNAGKWHLVVENVEPDRSVQALQVWSDIIINQYSQAMNSAIEQFAIAKQLEEVSVALTNSKLRMTELAEAEQGLQVWRADVSQLPDDEPVDGLKRWTAWSLFASTAGFDLAWQSLLNEFPTPQALPASYFPWLDMAVAFLENHIRITQTQIENLEQEHSTLTDKYEAAIQANHGLSANLEVGRQYIAPIEAEAVRSTGLTAFIGGVLGILVWSFLWLARPIYLAKK